MHSQDNIDSDVHDISSVECFDKLSKNSKSYLIDVRTKPELEFTGVPNLSILNKKTLFISWHEYPKMKINHNFQNQFLEGNLNKGDYIFLICRSGRRSFQAAKYLTSLGYNHSYNVSDGFEGDKNKLNQRSTINGWKYNHLPWKQ